MQYLKPIFSVMMAMLVTLSGMGFFVDHMVCSMSGQHFMAINAQVDHCSETCTLPAEGMSIQRHCCDYDSNYFKEDFLTQQKDERETITHSAFHFIAVSEFLLREFPSGNDAAIARVPDLPPLPSVRRHVLHQVFLI